MITDLKELLVELNKEPEEIKENEDGSKYVPISPVQSTLDRLFGYWSWDLEREQFGKNQATGKGTLIVTYPNGAVIKKSGTAGIELTGDYKLDYPRLEAKCTLNAAKKLGNVFGRNLNRDKDDSPLPVTQLRDNSIDEADVELKKTTELVKKAKTKTEALQILEHNGFKYNSQLKEIALSKP